MVGFERTGPEEGESGVVPCERRTGQDGRKAEGVESQRRKSKVTERTMYTTTKSVVDVESPS